MLNWFRRFLTKFRKPDSMLLLLVQDEPMELRQVDRHTRSALHKRLKNAEAQMRLAVMHRNVLALEFAAIELLAAIDIIKDTKVSIANEIAATVKKGRKLTASARRR